MTSQKYLVGIINRSNAMIIFWKTRKILKIIKTTITISNIYFFRGKSARMAWTKTSSSFSEKPSSLMLERAWQAETRRRSHWPMLKPSWPRSKRQGNAQEARYHPRHQTLGFKINRVNAAAEWMITWHLSNLSRQGTRKVAPSRCIIIITIWSSSLLSSARLNR